MRNKFISSLPLLKKPSLNIPVGASNAAGTEVHYNISIAGKDYNVYFKSSDAPLYAGIEPLLILALLPAMKLGADIVLTRPISRDLADNLEKFMKIFGSWYKDFNPVKILGERLDDLPAAGGKRVGAFFSGGVDSFYTLLKHKNEITDLIYIRGYDIDLDDARHRAVSEMCAKVARRLDKNLLVLETNTRRMLKGYGKWGPHQFGLALGSAAQILSARFRKIYIAADFDEENLRPWGSHPHTTPLFGNSVINIVYDGAEAKRIEKLKNICENDIALNYLRVCYENIAGTYNCGKCEKCLRTMIGLYALNKLKNCATFPAIIDASLLREKLYANEPARVFARENLSLLETQDRQRLPIYIALQRAISLPLWQVKLKNYYQSKIQKGSRPVKRH